MKIPIPNLHDELIVEILLRLPSRSLLRFKCVCKYWHSLISSKDFIEFHLTNSKKNLSTNGRIIFVSHASPGPGNLMNHFYLNLFTSRVVEEFPFHLPRGSIHIVDSCNGLICFSMGFKKFYLWNPSTRDFKILPQLVYDEKYVFFLEKAAFGLDELNKDYKILATGCRFVDGKDRGPRGESMLRHTKVYSLKSDSWRSTSIEVVEEEEPLDFVGKFVGGKFYWISEFPSVIGIVSFDLAKEVWGNVELPNDRGCDFCSSLGVLGGNLCMLLGIDGLELDIDVWVLKLNGVEESWVRVFTIPNYGKMDHSYSTLSCIGPEGGVILSREMDPSYFTSFIIYNVKEHPVETMKIDSIGYFGNVDSYIDSLVPLTCIA